MFTVTVTISIGLAVNGVAMGSNTAQRFVRELTYTLDEVDATVHFRGTGTGYSEEWGREAAHTVVASVHADRLPRLRYLLAVDSKGFEQDAIALTVGKTEFVKPL